MATLTPITELEAVNEMLLSIGELPINALGVSGLSDAGIAEQMLHNTSRAVQMVGWWFNREYNFPIIPDVNGYVQVPANVLKVDSSRVNNYIDVVQRGTRLYDRENHTYVFTNTYKYDFISFLAFSDLPEAARNYIAIKASRAFQRKVLGSDNLNANSKDDEREAYTALHQAESENEDANLLTNNYSSYSIISRRFNP